VEIGSLNKRIIFQEYTTTENEMGDSISTWVDFATVWASVTNLSGREYFAAMQVQAENTVKFTIRCNKNIDETMRIIFEGNNYNINFIDNIKYGNKFMEIKALAVV
jgi:SPP1 family predicted phage head-tail adaptor